MAGIAVWNALKIILVLRLSLPELSNRHDFGYDLAWPDTGRIDVSNCFERDLLLIVRRIKDRRAVACADIVPLPIEGTRVVYLKEELE